jgi:hypothetical protein
MDRCATIRCSDIHQHCNYPLQTDSLLSFFFEFTSGRSARPATFHSRVTIATTVTIQRSNLARSIANSMSAAKKIERNAIRFVIPVQIQEIRRTQPEFC